MKRLKKSKSVSWASGAKLCQVKLFLSEDCPSKVGLQAEDRLRAKAWMSFSNSVYSDNHHSRFEGRHSMDPVKEKLSHILQIKWKCPPKFVLSHNWHVAAGEESEEAETQKHRELRVLESVYPRLSDIPPSSSLPFDVQEDHLDDNHIPLIPVTPIEDEGAVDLPSDVAVLQNASFDSQSLALPRGLLSGSPNAPQCDPASLKPSANEKSAPEVLPGFQADVAAAAAAAITAIMKSKEHGSLIDTDLLVKFLSDPKMIEKLISEQGAPANTQTEPVSRSKPLTASLPLLSTKPGMVEEVINENGLLMKTVNTSITGSNLVTPSAAIASPKPVPVIKILTNEQAASISGSKLATSSMALPSPKSDPVIEKLIHKYTAPTHTRAAPVSGSKPVTSAFPSPRPDPVVKKLINEHGVPTDAGIAPFSAGKLATPLASLPSSKPDLVKIKRMINEYGTHDGIETEPMSRSIPLTLQLPMSSPKLGVVLPARMNPHPLPSVGETGVQLKALSTDASRPNLIALPNVMQSDLRMKAPSPDTVGLNLHSLRNVVQPSLQMKALSPDSVPTSSFLAMTAPLAKDINYIKNLIRQHGEKNETQDYNLSQSEKFHVQNPKLVPNLKPNELTPKIQKPCIFFNSPRGCRNGSNCLFRHDKPKMLQPGSVLENPNAKRMKLGGEITGRT